MVWIHRLEKWPDFSWDISALSLKLAEVRHRQGLLIGQMRSLGFEFRAEASVITLAEETVKSFAIEGEHLDSSEVRSSIARKLGVDVGGLVPSERKTDGIVDMMLDATRKFNEPLTSDRLFGWHATMFPTGRSGLVEINVGKWRSCEDDPMLVVSGPIGKERIHFEAPSGERLDCEMKQFFAWFNSNLGIDPLLKAGIAHFWFVTIHPFMDGNGRIARAIGEMALAQADGLPDRFYCLSRQLEAEKSDYYKQLECQQREKLDITDWLSWFLGCLDRSIVKSESSLSRVLFKAEIWQVLNLAPTNDRQRKVINRMLEEDFEGFISTSKYAKMAKCSTDTALRDILNLKQRGVLLPNAGGGRSTSYRLNEDISRKSFKI